MKDLEFARKHFNPRAYAPTGILSPVEARQLGRLKAAGRAERTHDGLFRIVEGDWLIEDILPEVDAWIKANPKKPLSEWGALERVIGRRAARLAAVPPGGES